MSTNNRRHDSERGQVLVIVAAGMVAFIAMVALVIDGGNAWAQQRDTQNGTDAAAEAGAVLLAQNLPYKAAGDPLPFSDDDVLAAVVDSAATNTIDLEGATYTDFDGNDLGIAVGSLGDVPPPAGANGVKATATREFDTLLAGFMGFDDLLTRSDATAHVGYVTEVAGATVLPITFPFTVPLCDGSGKLVPTTTPWVPGQEYILYLCKNEAAGNVGWLDWEPGVSTPPCTGGGAGELACSIEHPNNPPLIIPEWYFVTQTGNINSGQVQTALEGWIGKTIEVPLFDATCDVDPPDSTNFCPGGPGTGQNQWYHFKNWIGFTLREVHIQGPTSACMASNGGTGCLIGTFEAMMGPGVLGAPVGDESVLAKVGVGLIE